MGCISTPIPNHLSTHPYYFRSTINHTKQCGNKEKSGVEVEQMRRMVRSVDEWAVRLRR